MHNDCKKFKNENDKKDIIEFISNLENFYEYDLFDIIKNLNINLESKI